MRKRPSTTKILPEKKPRPSQGGLIQFQLRKYPTSSDIMQTQLVSETCLKHKERVVREFGNTGRFCSEMLQDRINGQIVEGKYVKDGAETAHSWLVKDETIFDAASISFGSSPFVVVPRDSDYARTHYKPERILNETGRKLMPYIET